MIQIKTLNQTFKVYQIEDNDLPSFSNALMRNDPMCQAYQVYKDFVNEIIVHAERAADSSRGTAGDRPTTGASEPSGAGCTSCKCNGSAEAK